MTHRSYKNAINARNALQRLFRGAGEKAIKKRLSRNADSGRVAEAESIPRPSPGWLALRNPASHLQINFQNIVSALRVFDFNVSYILSNINGMNCSGFLWPVPTVIQYA